MFAQAKAAGEGQAVTVDVDVAAATSPLAHFWEVAAGSDRAVIGLRDQWRQDLIRVHRETGIGSVRFHGLFDDEFGIAAQGPGALNFNYLDQVYDFMLDHGVRPFVELGFMPEAMASSGNRIFFYKGNTSPPRRWEEWRDLVQAFAQHCVERYGATEVRGWKFEVWNEPNIAFWTGSQADYFELYRQSALALRQVDRQLQVGGPATAQLGWIPDLIKYCSTQGAPLDFVSTHVYPSDPQTALFGKEGAFPYEEVIPRGLKQVQAQVQGSAMPHLPVLLSEWSSQNPAFIAETIKNCIGLADMMSYWTFSNVFEELGPPRFFNSSFGMLDQRGIARPSLHAFAMLHKLGAERLPANGPVLATRRANGAAAILVWNLIPEMDAGSMASGDPTKGQGGWFSDRGPELQVSLKLRGWRGSRTARISQVNSRSGSAYGAWIGMGSPASPTPDQLGLLRRAGELPEPSTTRLRAGHEVALELSLPPNGLALVEIGA